MHDLIAGWFGRVRTLFNRRAGAGTPLPAPEPSAGSAPPAETPPALPTPRTPEPLRPHCGVYVWATAHGIDLRPTGPLLACTCAAKPHPAHPASDSDALRAKVREANSRSTWGK